MTESRGTCRERFTVIHIVMSKRKVSKPGNKLLGYRGMNHGGDQQAGRIVRARIAYAESIRVAGFVCEMRNVTFYCPCMHYILTASRILLRNGT